MFGYLNWVVDKIFEATALCCPRGGVVSEVLSNWTRPFRLLLVTLVVDSVVVGLPLRTAVAASLPRVRIKVE